MAYNKKAPGVMSDLAARREQMIQTAIDIVIKEGLEKLTVQGMTARAGLSNGVAYKYFANQVELWAACVGSLLTRHLIDMRDDAAEVPAGPAQLASALAAIYRSWAPHARLTRALYNNRLYLDAVAEELAGIIGGAATMKPRERNTAAHAILGVAYAIIMSAHGGEDDAITFALRAIGLTEAQAGRAMEKWYSIDGARTDR
jgi:AcrR family transcriptional regulator